MVLRAYTDGASRGNPGESGIGILLKDEGGTIVYSGAGYIGRATNNIAEYEALLACLRKAAELGPERLVVHSDSQLLVRQLRGEYRVKNPGIRKLFLKAEALVREAGFPVEFVHIEREENAEADLLANAGIDSRRRLKV